MYPLKQSTAITVPFFVHDVNGDAVIGLVDAGFTKRISKNGTAFAAMTVTITEMENGFYSIPLSTTHSDTLGLLTILFTHASAKQINLQFRIHVRLPDDLAFPNVTGRGTDVDATGGVEITANQSVNVAQWSGFIVPIPSVTGVPEVDITHQVGGLVPAPTTTGVPDVNVERWLDTLVTLGAGAPDVNIQSMDANSIASGVIAAGELTNIENEIWDALKSAHVVANSFGDFLDIEVSGRMAETSINTTAGAVDTVTTTTTNTDMRGTDSAALASNYTAARAGFLDNLNISENVAGTSEVGHLVSASGTSDSGTITTMVDSVRTEIDDHWNGGVIVFGSGGSANNIGVSRLITDFVAASDTLTFAPAVLTAITTETYTIIPWATVNLLVATQTSIDAIETDTNSLNDTKIPNTLNTTALGNIGIDWANVENPTTALDLAGTDIQLVDTTTVNTDMRGTDSALLASSAPTNFGDLSIAITTGRIDVGSWLGTTVTTSATSAKPEVDISSISDDTVAANNLELDYDGTGLAKANSTIGTCTANTDMRGTDSALLATSAPTNFGDLAIVVTTGEIDLRFGQTLPGSPTADTVGDALKQATREEAIKKNAALSNFSFVMYDATDHITPITGRTVTGTRSLDAAAFVAVGGTFAEIANGAYQFDAVAADTNGDFGIWRFIATGADDVFISFKTVA